MNSIRLLIGINGSSEKVSHREALVNHFLNFFLRIEFTCPYSLEKAHKNSFVVGPSIMGLFGSFIKNIVKFEL